MSYYIRVQYPGPRGETLTRRLYIGADRPAPGRHPFDGTVWVSVDDPSDATLTPAGDSGRSRAYGLLAAVSLLASIILGVWGMVSWSDSLLPHASASPASVVPGGRPPGVGGASVGVSASADGSTLDDAWHLGDDGWAKGRNRTG